MVPEVESLDQQHQYHLGAYKNCKFLGTSPDLMPSETFRGRPRHWCFNKAPGGSDAQGNMSNTDVVHSVPLCFFSHVPLSSILFLLKPHDFPKALTTKPTSHLPISASAYKYAIHNKLPQEHCLIPLFALPHSLLNPPLLSFIHIVPLKVLFIKVTSDLQIQWPNPIVISQ